MIGLQEKEAELVYSQRLLNFPLFDKYKSIDNYNIKINLNDSSINNYKMLFILSSSLSSNEKENIMEFIDFLNLYFNTIKEDFNSSNNINVVIDTIAKKNEKQTLSYDLIFDISNKSINLEQINSTYDSLCNNQNISQKYYIITHFKYLKQINNLRLNLDINISLNYERYDIGNYYVSSKCQKLSKIINENINIKELFDDKSNIDKYYNNFNDKITKTFNNNFRQNDYYFTDLINISTKQLEDRNYVYSFLMKHLKIVDEDSFNKVMNGVMRHENGFNLTIDHYFEDYEYLIFKKGVSDGFLIKRTTNIPVFTINFHAYNK